MVDHALEGCGAAEPDDVCPVSPREFDLIEKQLEDYAACAGMQAIYDLRMKSVSKINKLRAWLERERV
jgi:hypothetical protein